MPHSAGPRLITHMADEEEPTLDPRLQLTAGMLHELQARKDRLADLHVAARSGDLFAFNEFTQAITEGFSFAAYAYTQLPTARARANAFVRDLPKELRTIRRKYINAQSQRQDPDAGKLEAVEVDGSVKEGWRLGYFRAALVDGTWGALQRRPDDCITAGIATFLQAPAHTIPDLKLGQLVAAGRDEEQMGRVIRDVMGAWEEQNAVTVRVHATKLPTDRRRWLGVVDADGDTGNSHCVLMQNREVIFDTAWLLPPRKGEPLGWHTYDDVSLGLTIDRR